MSLLERVRQPAGSATSEEEPGWRTPALGAGLGLVSTLASALLLGVPALLGWLADPHSTTSWSAAMSVGVDGWLLAHGATLSVDGLSLRLVPLLLAVVPLVVAAAAARALLARLAGLAGATAGSWWRCPAAVALGLFVLGHALGGVLLAAFAAGAATVSWPTLPAGLLVLPLLGVLLGLRREHRAGGEGISDEVALWLDRRTPLWLRRAVRPALAGVGAVLGAGAVVVLVQLVTHGSRVWHLYGELDAGVVGVAVLSLGQLLVLPNLVLWACGWMAGPGFAVGDVAVSWTHVDPGVLPLVPVFGALPQPGALPPGLWLGALVPVAAGGFVGWRCLRSTARLSPWRLKAGTAATASVLAALLLGALSWLASGGLGSDHLAHVGVHALSVTVVLLLELLAGAVTTVSVVHWRQTRR